MSAKPIVRPRNVIKEASRTTLVPASEQADPVKQAQIWLRKARTGSIQWVDMCTDRQYEYYLWSKRTKFIGTIGKVGLLLVTIFDMPSWCRGTPFMCETYIKQLYSPLIPVLPHRIAAGVSIIFWFCIGSRMVLRRLALGDAYTFRRWNAFAIVVVVLGTASAFAGVFLPIAYNVSVLCRPFVFMATTKTLRDSTSHVFRSLPGFFDVLLSMAICVFIFVWVGMVMFSHSSEGNQYFKTWFMGFNQMWILYTINNTPDVMIPSMQKNVLNFCFFAIYVLLVTYILSSVLLARVYDSYKDVVKSDFSEFHEHQRVAITRAFSLLANISIEEKTYKEFVHGLCDPYLGCIEVADIDDKEHNLEVFETILSHDHKVEFNASAGINLDQFKQILHVCFSSGLVIPPRKNTEVDESQGTWVYFFLHGTTIRGRTIEWDHMVDMTILVNVIITFWEAVEFRNQVFHHLPLWQSQSWWILFALSVFYTCEFTFQIWVLGFSRFWNWKPVQHRSDFIIVYATFLLTCCYGAAPYNRVLERSIILFHMFRGARLVAWIAPLHDFFTLVIALIPVYSQMGMLLFFFFWVFNDIGQLWFGGLIYTSNPLLAGTEFASDQLWALNFNDFISGMVTLFTLLVQCDWNEVSSGYIAATGSTWALVYFVVFCIVINMMVMNILIALILDCSGALAEAQADMQQLLEQAEEEDAEVHATETSEVVRQETIMRKVLAAEDDYFGKVSSSSSSSDSSGQRDFGNTEATSSIRHLVNSKFTRHSIG